MSNEVKVALLAIVTIALTFWEYKFILGNNILRPSNIYYAEYDDVQELRVSTSVLISGVKVGRVADIFLKPDNYDRVIVKLDLERGIRIPKDAVARIVASGFMGDKYMALVYDKECLGDDCAESGDTLRGEFFSLLRASLPPDELEATLSQVTDALESLVDTINTNILQDEENSTLARTLANLESTTANLESSSGQIDRFLRRNSDQLDNTLAGLDALSGTLQRNSSRFDSIFSNLETISGEVAREDLGATLDSIRLALSSFNQTLNSADDALASVTGLVDGINRGDGTLGKLAQDDELYDKFAALSRQVDSLVTDIQERPYRYVPFKNRKKVLRYDRKDAKQEAGN
jgi:phospholipid/cholesterol/gamma-HCH transport system substrate-binding protein